VQPVARTLSGVSIKARLDGHEFDLQDLADWLPSGGIRVAKDSEGFYLEAAAIDNPPGGKTFYEAAQEVLKLLNGLGRTKTANFRPVTLAGYYQDGDQRHVVVSPDSVVVRSRVSAVAIVTGPDGVPKAPPPPAGPAYVALAGTYRGVAEALTVLATEPLGWADLYKVFEIVRDAVKPVKLDQTGLATRDDISAFTASANRPDVSGEGARHARMDGGLPKRTMPIGQARQFISDLVRRWMDTLQ
jgi:hypothetical protein